MENTDTLIVKPSGAFKVLSLPLIYNNTKTGKTIFVSSEGRLHVMPTGEYQRAAKSSDQATAKSFDIKTLTFEHSTNQRSGVMQYAYKVIVDVNGEIVKPKEGEDCVGDQAYAVFLTEAVFCNVDGNKANSGRLDVTFVNKGRRLQTNNNKRMLEVAGHLRDMYENDPDKLFDVASILGQSTGGKTAEDIYMLLGDMKTGIIYGSNNMNKFFEFIENKSPDAPYVIAINKAIELGIIQKGKNGQQDVLTFNNVVLGNNTETALFSMKKDPATFNALKLALEVKKSESGGNTKSLVKDSAKDPATEEKTKMREALQQIRKTDANPEGVDLGIGKKQLYQIKDDQLKELYDKYVLNKE